MIIACVLLWEVIVSAINKVYWPSCFSQTILGVSDSGQENVTPKETYWTDMNRNALHWTGMHNAAGTEWLYKAVAFISTQIPSHNVLESFKIIRSSPKYTSESNPFIMMNRFNYALVTVASCYIFLKPTTHGAVAWERMDTFLCSFFFVFCHLCACSQSLKPAYWMGRQEEGWHAVKRKFNCRQRNYPARGTHVCFLAPPFPDSLGAIANVCVRAACWGLRPGWCSPLKQHTWL